ncbi:MAG: hypothetical protein GBAus27B_000584 [Mycoplasmataceae bacterium]|nr:MAG: hypothetical protein GBAus27B_000584 [Mycoplasmataceae bacterium]
MLRKRKFQEELIDFTTPKLKKQKQEEKEWCCSNCQQKVLNEGAGACKQCSCSCHKAVQNWEQWLIQKSKKNKNRTHLIIKPNKFRFPVNKLTITKEQFPKLTHLYANNCGLQAVGLASDTLTHLYLNGNELTNIGLDEVSKLQEITVSNNKIESLEVKHLKNLKDLNISNNVGKLRSLDISNLTSLSNLVASASYLKEIISENCVNLESLDIDINDLNNLDFSHLTKLIKISVRQNNMLSTVRSKKTLLLNSSHLEHINALASDVKEIINRGVIYNQFNPEPFLATLDNLDKFTIIWKNTKKQQQKTSEDAPNLWEQDEYERQQEREREEFEKEGHIYQGQTHLDLSGSNWIKSIEIDGDKNYPQSLKSINLGDNYLEEVIVRNMPNLVRLIISHNKVSNLVIENCPKLDLLYDYKSGDESRVAPPEAQEYQEEKDNPIKQEQEDKNKIIAQIILLLEQAETALTNKDYPQLERLITQIKELASQVQDELKMAKLNEQIARLEQACQNQKTVVQPSNYWPLIIFATVPFLIFPIVYLLTKKWIYGVKTDKKK